VLLRARAFGGARERRGVERRLARAGFEARLQLDLLPGAVELPDAEAGRDRDADDRRDGDRDPAPARRRRQRVGRRRARAHESLARAVGTRRRP
jgi:hypothetical protein